MSPDGHPASLQTRLLNLIARSYTVVKVQSVLDMTGLTQDQLQLGLTVCDCAVTKSITHCHSLLCLEVSARKWQFDEAMNTIIINQSGVCVCVCVCV